MRGEERGRALALTDIPGPPAKLRRGGTTSPTVTLSIMATATLSMRKGTEAQRVWEIQGRSHEQREQMSPCTRSGPYHSEGRVTHGRPKENPAIVRKSYCCLCCLFLPFSFASM